MLVWYFFSNLNIILGKFGLGYFAVTGSIYYLKIIAGILKCDFVIEFSKRNTDCRLDFWWLD